MTNNYKRIKEYLVHETDLRTCGFSGSYRQEIAKRMGCSVQTADRYKMGNRLIFEFQEMIREGRMGLSSLHAVATAPNNMQLGMYSLFLQVIKRANELGLRKKVLSRKNCNILANLYKEGVRNINNVWPCLFTEMPLNSKVKKAEGTNPISLATGNDEGADGEDALSNYEKGKKFRSDCLRTLIFYGFTAQVTPDSNDHGVDIIAEKNGIKYAVQCKWVKKGSVEKSALYELFWGLNHYNCNVGIVLSNGIYGSSIRQAAKEKNILLWSLVDIADHGQNT